VGANVGFMEGESVGLLVAVHLVWMMQWSKHVNKVLCVRKQWNANLPIKHII
jgi:hypothetical protein